MLQRQQGKLVRRVIARLVLNAKCLMPIQNYYYTRQYPYKIFPSEIMLTPELLYTSLVITLLNKLKHLYVKHTENVT